MISAPKFIVRSLVLSALGLAAAGCSYSSPEKTIYSWNLERDPGASDVQPARSQPVAAAHDPQPFPYVHPVQSQGGVSVSSLPPPGASAAPRSLEQHSDASYGPEQHTDFSYAPEHADISSSAPPDEFAWPLQGHVISAFGTKSNGEQNDGINIASDYGIPIHAAAGGTVTYAGDELKGYGNLVLIRHDDGYVTAYAHAQTLSVRRGEVVTRGQVIGYVGDTGGVGEPQLHFEIRRGKTPVDPLTLLGAQSAHAS